VLKKSLTKVFYVDPMSYHNLALYDYNLLSNIDKQIEVSYFGNKQYDLDSIKNIKKIYNYSYYKSNVLKAISYIYSQFKLLGEIKRQKCKVLHLQWSRMPYFDYLFITHLKKKYGVKIVYTSHDTFTHNFEKKKKKKFIKFMKKTDYIIVHTKKSKEILKAHNIYNVVVINHGLLDIRNLYKNELINFNKENKIVFSLLGYMEEYKGTDLLLKAWLGSKKLYSNKDILLLVIGKNKMTYKPIIKPGDNIIYKDELISDSRFANYMKITDVVVLPYQKISQSGLLLTALAMNKVFIVNDVGEIAKPIKKYKIGWIIKENKVEGLKKQLEQIVEEIKENGIKKVSDEIQEKINTDYSWERAGKLTSQLYNK